MRPPSSPTRFQASIPPAHIAGRLVGAVRALAGMARVLFALGVMTVLLPLGLPDLASVLLTPVAYQPAGAAMESGEPEPLGEPVAVLAAEPAGPSPAPGQPTAYMDPAEAENSAAIIQMALSVLDDSRGLTSPISELKLLSGSAGPVKPFSYVVQGGDTLLGIARRFKVTPETVLWANDLGNGELIQIGHELTILPVSGVLHRVQRGDTVAAIADLYIADARAVAEANSLGPGDLLEEGRLLVVPGGVMRTTEEMPPPPSPTTVPAPTALPSAPTSPPPTKAPAIRQDQASGTTYTVKAGDTLYSIASSFKVPLVELSSANGITDPSRVRVGQQLSIPAGRQGQPGAPVPSAAQTPVPPPTATRPPATPTAVPTPVRTAVPTPVPPKATPVPPAAPPPAGSSRGAQIAAIAQKYLGYKYQWGGHSPAGFDCSGFTWYVYKEAGLNVPNHNLAGQMNAGPRIPREQLQPGDLVFFQNTYAPGLSHSGVFLGSGRFINAETEKAGVQVRALSDPYWSSRFLGGSRPW